MINPTSLWLTINPSDTNDPIVQVFAGEEIDMDTFVATAGPDSTWHAKNIVADPFAAAKFFHYIIKVVLEELFGIRIMALPANKGYLGLLKDTLEPLKPKVMECYIFTYSCG